MRPFVVSCVALARHLKHPGSDDCTAANTCKPDAKFHIES